MAYIYKSAALTSSPLASADYSRQKDIFKLSLMGNAQCKRLWEDFATEEPATARLIVSDVAIEKSEKIKANKRMDKVLVKAENKPKKVTKSAKAPKTAINAKSEKAYYRALLNSPDPVERETAWQALNG